MVNITGQTFIFKLHVTFNSAVSRYDEMPVMNYFDSFEKCPAPKGKYEKMVPYYCVLNVFIDEPTPQSRLFGFMKKFSSDSNKHFKHDKLKRGVCMQTCVELHEFLDQRAMDYKNDDTPIVEEGLRPDIGLMRIYNRLCNICINRNLDEKFKLRAKTSIDYCLEKEQVTVTTVADTIFFVLSSLILFLIVASAVFQKFRNRPKVDRVFARLRRTKRWLDVFNVRENFWKLMENDQNDLDSVTCLHASKIVIMFLFVFIQVYRHIASMPFTNPIYVEQVRKRKLCVNQS